MRRISADWIFSVAQPPIQNGVVTVADDGTITEVGEREGYTDDEVEVFEGAIVPGFVNTHCHLELSHMKGMLEEGTGLISFIKGVLGKREAPMAVIEEAIANAEKEMIKNGIVAVGDISNTDHTFPQKFKNNLHYHTFVEVFNLMPDAADETFAVGEELWQKLRGNGQRASIVPHAPYTVSPELFRLTDEFNLERNLPSSLHNQETVDENLFFIDGTGGFRDFYRDWGFNIDFFKPTGKKSLPSITPHLSGRGKMLLVHNTMTERDDIQLAHDHFDQVYWCFNPNANLYIEGKLPNYQLFLDENAKCTLGTDSLASNWQLSILEEMKVISKHVSEVDFEMLLKWATFNGAEALDLSHKIGSLEKGKNPGLNLITNFDPLDLRLQSGSRVHKLL